MSLRRAIILLVVLALGLLLVMPVAYSATNGHSSTGDDDRWSDAAPVSPGGDDGNVETGGAEPAGEEDGDQQPVDGDPVERTGLPKIEFRILLYPPMIYLVIR